MDEVEVTGTEPTDVDTEVEEVTEDEEAEESA